MAVEDVNKPKTVKDVDPRAAAEKGSESITYWKNKAEEARARHDYQAEEEAIKMLGRTPDPGFQIKGSLDLGNMNPGAQAKETQERTDKVIETKDADLKTEREKSESLAQKLADEKVDSLRRDFGNQMTELNKTIEKLITTKDTRSLSEQFKDQFTTAKEIAESMGLEKTTNGQDPMVQIELKKMEFAEAQKDREFKVKMAQDDRQWQVQLIEIKDNREFKKAELAQQARRNDMIADLPAIIGGAIGKGAHERAGAVAGQPGTAGRPVEQKAWKVQIGEGETAEFDCPGCGTAVGIGPTTEIAECINCHKQFPIERVTAPAVTEEHKEPIPTEEE